MATRKCYSTCRKRVEDECGPPECKYINGSRRKYCRLSYAYKMDENCIAQPKPVKNKPREAQTSRLKKPVMINNTHNFSRKRNILTRKECVNGKY